MQCNEQIREEERRYIAREIHDELGQVLTAIKMNAALLARTAPHTDSWRDDVKHLLQLIDGCIKVVRNITLHLRPPVLALGLVPALQWLVNQFVQMNGIACELTTDGDASNIREPYLTTLFRMAQESLTNVARHAEARTVSIKLSSQPTRISLIVTDDGHGFDVDTELKACKGIGLNGILHRIQLLDGEFEIRSNIDGTTLRCSMPVNLNGEQQ